jgi:tetratricopeptide (TPR) repeat protein/transcriptional regulator with XRE-family HTH domain
MKEDISVGYWIKRRRKSLDLTQADLANRVGCALITIAKIEADERRPSREMAQLLARHLQVAPPQAELFVRILRGEKSSRNLEKLNNFPTQPTGLDLPSLESEEMRIPALIARISRGRLVGRRVELASALHEWETAQGGESRVLVFHGEPGIGKSRLAGELILHAQSQNARTLVSECYSGGERPYAPFARILQNVRAFPADFPRAALADLKAVAPQLEARCPDVPPNPKLEPLAEQARLFESVYLLFNRLAEQAPLLLLVEDIHWADHGTLELIRSLAHRFHQAGERMLLLLTAREELPPESGLPLLFDELLRARLSTSIRLDRFDQEETRALLASIFDQEITDEFIALIHRETQGNPFFIEEVCKDLIENGDIYWLDDHWERKELDKIHVPPSVQTAIQARLNKLPKSTQEILLMAAILGRRFDFDVLRAALELQEESLIEALESARRAQVITDVEGSSRIAFEFSHNLISTVLLETVSAARRRTLHKKAAEVTEKIQPTEFSLLASHCCAAGDIPRALAYFRKAAERAMQVYAHENAVRYYSEALSLVEDDPAETCRLLLARIKIYDLLGQRSLQAADLESARRKAEAAREVGLCAEVEMAMAEFALQSSEQASVIEHAQQAIQLGEQANLPAVQAQAYMLWGRALSETGELQEARQRLTQARELSRQAGFPLIEARSLINLGNVDYRLGDCDAARDKYISALQPVRALGERRIECMTLNNLGNVAWLQGDLEASVDYYSQSLFISTEIGDKLNQGRTLSNLGSIYTEQFRYSEALHNLEQALALLRALGQRGDEVVALSHLGEVMEALGRYEEARQYKESALEIAREIEDIQIQAEILYGLSRIHLYERKYEQAEQAARAALTLSEDPDLRAEASEAWHALGRACFMQEKWDESARAFAAALDLFQQMGLNAKSAEASAELARLAERAGNHAQALEYLSSVLPNRETETLAHISDPTLCLCACLVLEQEDACAASILLENGHATIQRSLEKIKTASAREHYLKHIPNHIRLMEIWQERHP